MANPRLVPAAPFVVRITEDPTVLVTDPLPRLVTSRVAMNVRSLIQADLIASRWAARNPNYLNGGK